MAYDQFGNYYPDEQMNMQQMQMNQMQMNMQAQQMQMMGYPQQRQPKITYGMLHNAFKEEFQKAGVQPQHINVIDDSSRPTLRHCCTAVKGILFLPRRVFNMFGYPVPYYMCEYCKRGYYNKEDIPNPNDIM